jgi:hypothetical protein
MKSTERIVWLPFVRIFFVIGVIACLCFSAGEGLRLTPLPALALEETNSSALLVSATFSRGTPQYLGGPLDRPAQVQLQKSSKRQLLDFECPSISGTVEISLHPLPYVGASDRVDRASRMAEAQPPGRAPPRFY